MRIGHEFVESFPEKLKPGILYVSMPFASTAHLCACGCGCEVVTPLRKDAWRFSYDGESISISPSIGSWNLPCQSHYWITNSEIRLAGRWTFEEIQRARGVQSGVGDALPEPSPIEDDHGGPAPAETERAAAAPHTSEIKAGFWTRFWKRLGL